MKKLLLYIGAGILLLSACHDLNLNPLSSGSTENMGHRTKRILRIERKEYQTY